MLYNTIMSHAFSILAVMYVMISTATSQGAPTGPAFTSHYGPMSFRRPVPLIRKPQNAVITQAAVSKSTSSSIVKGRSKYIWYSSHPFPSELQSRLIGTLPIPISAHTSQNSTRPKQSYSNYYFLSDLTKDELTQYSGYIAPNAPVSLEWNHREKVVKTPLGHRLFRAIAPITKTAIDTSILTTAPGVNMYIIDTGVDVSLPEFSENNPIALNFSNDTDSDDIDGHGTHVASLALGTHYGIARHANLISLKVFDSEDNADVQNIIEAIRYAMNHTQQRRDSTEPGHVFSSIINLSVGVGQNNALFDIVAKAHKMGIYIVTAAGNKNHDACLGAISGSVYAITVAATDSRDHRAPFSNFGPCVNLYAPGVNITAAVPSYINSTGTEVFSGTSMASPIAAGVLAVYLSKFGDTEGYKIFRNQSLLGKVPNNPRATPNKMVYLNTDLFSRR